jgi:hypothetical protein
LQSPIIYFPSKVKIFFIYNLSTEKKNRLSPNSCCSRFSPFSFNLVLPFFFFEVSILQLEFGTFQPVW